MDIYIYIYIYIYMGYNVFLTFYAISNISFTYSYWLNGRWFLQIVDI